MFELTCSDFEEWARAVQGADCRVMRSGPEESGWWLRIVELLHLSLQLAHEGAPNVFEGATWPNSINLLTSLDGAPFTLNGEAFTGNSLGLLAPGCALTTLLNSGVSTWASIAIPVSVFGESCAPNDDRRLQQVLSGRTSLVRTDPRYVARLHRLIGQIVPLARAGGLDDGESRRSAESEMLYATTLALADSFANREDHWGRPSVSRRLVVDRALEWMTAHWDGALRVTELAQAAGVSERTLRNVFIECFGMGPLRYIRLRQVHQVHAALLAADPERTTVTGVAMKLGIWDVDGLAARYRRVFGQSPRSTLRNPPSQRQLEVQ